MSQRVIAVAQHLPDGSLWDIKDFLGLVTEEGKDLFWDALDGDTEFEVVYRNEFCYLPEAPFSFQELQVFADRILQTVWGTYIGDRDPERLKSIDNDYLDRIKDLNIDIAFEAVDSSYWLVTARDEALLQRIEALSPRFIRRTIRQ
jgi:hypothetical protein